jgi:hypothetical protein
MKKKECGKCKQIKTLHGFAKCSRKDGLQTWCKKCSNENTLVRYKKNPKSFFDLNQKRAKRYRRKIHEYLEMHPCEECGEAEIRVLQFHHRDPDQKEYTISDMVFGCSWDRIMCLSVPSPVQIPCSTAPSNLITDQVKKHRHKDIIECSSFISTAGINSIGLFPSPATP